MTSPGYGYMVLRKQRGLTQEQVAERAHTTQPTVANIEAGRHAPTPEVRGRLDVALALGEKGTPNEAPAYVLAVVMPDGSDQKLADDDGRIAVFQRHDIADAVAALLRPLMPLVITYPVWPSLLRGWQEQGGTAVVLDAGRVADVLAGIGSWIAAFAHAAGTHFEFEPVAPLAPEQTTRAEVPA